jgi:hypothetical protein
MVVLKVAGPGAISIDPTAISTTRFRCSQKAHSLRTEYKLISSEAFSNRSGGVDGRPAVPYMSPHHPLWAMKRFADRALVELSPTFDVMSNLLSPALCSCPISFWLKLIFTLSFAPLLVVHA